MYIASIYSFLVVFAYIHRFDKIERKQYCSKYFFILIIIYTLKAASDEVQKVIKLIFYLNSPQSYYKITDKYSK